MQLNLERRAVELNAVADLNVAGEDSYKQMVGSKTTRGVRVTHFLAFSGDSQFHAGLQVRRLDGRVMDQGYFAVVIDLDDLAMTLQLPAQLTEGELV